MTADEPSPRDLLRNCKLLIVDDDAEIRRMIASMLKPTLASVSEAGSGREAELRIRESAFDVIVLDWNLVDMPALELLERAERTRPGVSSRCLVVTGDLIDSRNPHEAERRGLALLRKPFRPGDLVSAVRRTLGD